MPIRQTSRPTAPSVRTPRLPWRRGFAWAGLLNLTMGQDANWDLRNYHWYNPYSFLNGRFFFDVVPAQTPSFYNPMLDVPFFLLGNAVPAPVAFSVLALVQGLNFILLFALAHALLRIDRPLVKVWAAAAIALVGVAGGGNLSQIGTTFHDNTVSLGVYGGMLLVVRQWDRITSGPASSALGMTFLAGLLAGSAMGLKQPSVIYCIGVCFAFAVVPVAPKRRFLLILSCGLGIVAAVALLSGHWMWFLWETHGNPLHPYYNHIFKSPLGAISDYKDLHYHPKTALDRLTLPFRFSIDPLIVGEIVFRDFRIVTLYVLLPIAALASLVKPRNTARRRPFGSGTDPLAADRHRAVIRRLGLDVLHLSLCGTDRDAGTARHRAGIGTAAAFAETPLERCGAGPGRASGDDGLGHLGTVGLGKTCG